MRVQKFRLELYQHGLCLSCVCGFPISLNLHMKALCLLLGLKWQPPSGKACPLNRIHENRLPHATEILGYYKDCRWLNQSCFHPDYILPFPIRENPPEFLSQFFCINLCTWSPGILVLAQDPALVKGASRPWGESQFPRLAVVSSFA